MKKCPKCLSIIPSDEASFCNQCGHSLAEVSEDKKHQDNTSDDDLDFVVTEANAQVPDFVGGVNQNSPSEDDLGLQSTADLMENEAHQNGDEHASSLNDSPIGESAPPLPPEPAYDEPPVQQEIQKPPTAEINKSYEPEPMNTDYNSEKTEDMIPKSEPKEEPTYLSDQEKSALINKIEKINEPLGSDDPDKPFSNQPIDPSKFKKNEQVAEAFEAVNSEPAIDPDLPKPKMAQKSRGIAYFYKNYIQLKGDQILHEHDEVTVNDRYYLLKEKKISTKVWIAMAAPVFILILFIIGAQFIRDIGEGEGKLIGITLDENDNPYIQGAYIYFPELDKTFKANPQGFFKTDFLPSGSYRIEYIIDDEIVGIDQVSIFKNEINTLTLRPSDESLAEEENNDDLASASPANPNAGSQVNNTTPTPAKTSKTPKTSSKSTKSSSKKKSSSSSKKGSVTLSANVDNARFKLDGKILGAGNLKFKNISPGKHKYEVSHDGYASKSGTIDVPSGKNYTLKVSLSSLTAKDKEKTYDEEDFYYSGVSAYKDDDYKTAISDFSEAIKIKPSYAEAYFARAEAQNKIGYPENRKKAHDDYVRAAEIYQFRNDYNSAIMAYRNAIEVDPKSVTAHLGRAKVYLKKGEEIAAIADFEVVTDLDKRNADAYFGLGEARFRQGYFEKAIKHFKDARSLNPDNPSVYQYLMLSYMGDHDYKNVKKTFEKYQEIATEDQLSELYKDKKFSAVMEIINRE